LLRHPEIGGELIRLLSRHRRVHKTKVVSKGLGGGCLHLGSERLLLRLSVDIQVPKDVVVSRWLSLNRGLVENWSLLCRGYCLWAGLHEVKEVVALWDLLLLHWS
jgi:hypothetical protein